MFKFLIQVPTQWERIY